MIANLRTLLMSPRFWLPLAVSCFLAAMVIGYHQDQMAAESVLAKKVAGGSAEAYKASPILTGARALLHIVSITLLGLALMLRLSTARKNLPRNPDKRDPSPTPQETPVGFQPILTQEEIATEKGARHDADLRGRAASKLAQSLADAIRPVKSQP